MQKSWLTDRLTLGKQWKLNLNLLTIYSFTGIPGLAGVARLAGLLAGVSCRCLFGAIVVVNLMQMKNEWNEERKSPRNLKLSTTNLGTFPKCVAR